MLKTILINGNTVSVDEKVRYSNDIRIQCDSNINSLFLENQTGDTKTDVEK